MNSFLKKNVQHIIDNALCTGCGACSGICPHKAVTMIYNAAGFLHAQIDQKSCKNCKICLNVCPSNPDDLNNDTNTDIFHGKARSGYIGYATDNKIRKSGQSGGLVTALLCYLLENKVIKGAIVNKFNSYTNKVEAVLAKSKKSIIEGSGSYYIQTPVVETILKNGEFDIAAVVLGCQGESLMKIKQKYNKHLLPLYTFGLFCAGQNSSLMLSDLVKQTNVNNKSIESFRFRDKSAGGWPGNVCIYTKNGNMILNKNRRLSLKQIYESYRCILCFNQMNIYCDIAFGDPWGIYHKNNTEGNTVLVTRTKKGEELIHNAQKDRYIFVEEIPIKTILDGQTVDGRHKTKFFTAMEICNYRGWLFPYKKSMFKRHCYINNKYKNYLSKRLKYTRLFYLENKITKIYKLIILKKLALKSHKIFIIKRIARGIGKLLDIFSKLSDK